MNNWPVFCLLFYQQSFHHSNLSDKTILIKKKSSWQFSCVSKLSDKLILSELWWLPWREVLCQWRSVAARFPALLSGFQTDKLLMSHFSTKPFRQIRISWHICLTLRLWLAFRRVSCLTLTPSQGKALTGPDRVTVKLLLSPTRLPRRWHHICPTAPRLALANTQQQFCHTTIQVLQRLLISLLHLLFTVVAEQMTEVWPTKPLSLSRKSLGFHF